LNVSLLLFDHQCPIMTLPTLPPKRIAELFYFPSVCNKWMKRTARFAFFKGYQTKSRKKLGNSVKQSEDETHETRRDRKNYHTRVF